MRNTDHLELPRILYKGPDDQGRLPEPAPITPLSEVLANASRTDQLAREAQERREDPTQTCRVETRDELEAKLADGWRLHRALDKAEVAAADAAEVEAHDVDKPAPATKAAAAAASKKAGK